MDVTSYLLGKKSGGGGTSDYSELSNKPSINNVTLSGNKTTSDLGLFSGSYNDLSNKPEIIPILDVPLSGTGANESTSDTTALSNASEIINYFYNNNIPYCAILFRGNASKNQMGYNVYDTTTTTQRTSYTFYSVNSGTYDLISFERWKIEGSWSNNVFSASTIRHYAENMYKYDLKDFVKKDNTSAYSVTSDYNPAHKKYVDDSIASAITDALGGSY